MCVRVCACHDENMPTLFLSQMSTTKATTENLTSNGIFQVWNAGRHGNREAVLSEWDVCMCPCLCVRVCKHEGWFAVQAASFQQLLAFPADLALNSLNLPAESRNWATRGILCETGKAQRRRVDSGRKKTERERGVDRKREGRMKRWRAREA